MKCGQERWAIKTLTDSEATAVGDAAPQNITATALIGTTAPANLSDARAPLEKQRFHATALIIGWKIEEATSAENFGKKAPSQCHSNRRLNRSARATAQCQQQRRNSKAP